MNGLKSAKKIKSKNIRRIRNTTKYSKICTTTKTKKSTNYKKRNSANFTKKAQKPRKNLLKPHKRVKREDLKGPVFYTLIYL